MGQAAANSALAPVMSMRISSRVREVSVISVTWMRWSNASCDTAAVRDAVDGEAVAVDLDGDAVAGQEAGELGHVRGADGDGGSAAGERGVHRLGGEQLAGADDDEVVGEHGELGDQVAGHEHRAALVGEAAERGAQPADAVGVESVGGLVEQQHLGFAEQGAGEGEALAHAEREAAGRWSAALASPTCSRTSSTRP